MRVLIADDHALFRDGLKMQVEAIEEGADFAEASNYAEQKAHGEHLARVLTWRVLQSPDTVR